MFGEDHQIMGDYQRPYDPDYDPDEENEEDYDDELFTSDEDTDGIDDAPDKSEEGGS